jgi:hypothetical protein
VTVILEIISTNAKPLGIASGQFSINCTSMPPAFPTSVVDRKTLQPEDFEKDEAAAIPPDSVLSASEGSRGDRGDGTFDESRGQNRQTGRVIGGGKVTVASAIIDSVPKSPPKAL